MNTITSCFNHMKLLTRVSLHFIFLSSLESSFLNRNFDRNADRHRKFHARWNKYLEKIWRFHSFVFTIVYSVRAQIVVSELLISKRFCIWKTHMFLELFTFNKRDKNPFFLAWKILFWTEISTRNVDRLKEKSNCLLETLPVFCLFFLCCYFACNLTTFRRFF